MKDSTWEKRTKAEFDLAMEEVRQLYKTYWVPFKAELVLRDMGTIAGKCVRKGTYEVRGREWPAHWEIIINTQLTDHDFEETRDTIRHELAHMVTDIKYIIVSSLWHRDMAPEDLTFGRGAWSAHGQVWQDVARDLGASTDRCHRLPLKPVRQVRRFLYETACGKKSVLSSIRHNRAKAGRRYAIRVDGKQVPLEFRQELKSC